MSDAQHLSPVSSEEFGDFVAELDYPLFVVTTQHAGQRSGCLVGFATQVSIDPPRMLVCISDKNHTYPLALQADLVAVHVLSPGKHELAELFGDETGDRTDKFAHCSWHPGPGDVPVVDGAARHMVGRILQRVPFGDHLGLLLEPVETSVGDAPVAFTLREAADIEPGHDA